MNKASIFTFERRDTQQASRERLERIRKDRVLVAIVLALAVVFVLLVISNFRLIADTPVHAQSTDQAGMLGSYCRRAARDHAVAGMEATAELKQDCPSYF